MWLIPMMLAVLLRIINRTLIATVRGWMSSGQGHDEKSQVQMLGIKYGVRVQIVAPAASSLPVAGAWWVSRVLLYLWPRKPSRCRWPKIKNKKRLLFFLSSAAMLSMAFVSGFSLVLSRDNMVFSTLGSQTVRVPGSGAQRQLTTGRLSTCHWKQP